MCSCLQRIATGISPYHPKLSWGLSLYGSAFSSWDFCVLFFAVACSHQHDPLTCIESGGGSHAVVSHLSPQDFLWILNFRTRQRNSAECPNSRTRTLSSHVQPLRKMCGDYPEFSSVWKQLLAVFTMYLWYDCLALHRLSQNCTIVIMLSWAIYHISYLVYGKFLVFIFLYQVCLMITL